MTELPSYEEATARPDWLELVAPYVHHTDYWRLSLVNRRFWHIFAPRIWNSPLKFVRLSGLDPSDDVSWWFDFVFNRLSSVRATARALVRVLDATQFAKESYHFASDLHDRNMQLSFSKALDLLPNTECILLDGHTELDLGFLVGDRSADRHYSPLLLSIADCSFELSGNFFASQLLRRLVHLDISGIPGSVKSILDPQVLPALRVLKLRGRELDDSSFIALVQVYGLRLWSLDFSGNRVTDRVVPYLGRKCFPQQDLRSSSYFFTEGRLSSLEGGNEDFGPFMQIDESQWSKGFNHPERFFIDSPAYQANAQLGVQEYEWFRANGRGHIRSDAAEHAVHVLTSEDAHSYAPSALLGLTHLHVSSNSLSATGLQRLIRTSNGQLEYLACDSMPLLPSWQTQNHWPLRSSLKGIIGGADVFRPIFSSNLRALKIHHSFVTGILELSVDGLSSLSRAYLAERAILPRTQSLYHGSFIPDMNPRLSSLVLTHIPRRSSGPLIHSLIGFLKLLSEQERAIQEVTSSAKSSWRAPNLVTGLRHVRLEFDPDPMEVGYSTTEDLDAGNLMSSGEQGFSFFEGEKYEKSPPVVVRHGTGAGQAENADPGVVNATVEEPDSRQEYLSYDLEWEGKRFSCQVWLGPTQAPPNSALHQYRRLVQTYGVTSGVGPASPSQLRAGAPVGSFVFHTAWSLAIMPDELRAPPKSDLEVMKDVVEALKRYRLEGRARLSSCQKATGSQHVKLGGPHYFWTGKLEVSLDQPLPQVRAAGYWR